MAAAITAGEQVQSRPPTVVLNQAFKGTLYGGVQYAVLPDGQHFVFPRNAPVEPVRELRLVFNWFEELKAKVPTLQGCHTQARSLDELMERIKEAIQLCLEVQGDASEKLDFVGVQRVRLAS